MKVERPDGGDPARRDLFRALVRQVDLVVENFSLRVQGEDPGFPGRSVAGPGYREPAKDRAVVIPPQPLEDALLRVPMVCGSIEQVDIILQQEIGVVEL
jgi:hypothetical protein